MEHRCGKDRRAVTRFSHLSAGAIRRPLGSPVGSERFRRHRNDTDWVFVDSVSCRWGAHEHCIAFGMIGRVGATQPVESKQKKNHTITVGPHMLAAPPAGARRSRRRESTLRTPKTSDVHMHKSLSVNCLVAVTAQSRDSVMERWAAR